MPIILERIYRYPVKGLSPEGCARTVLAAGEGIPEDRRFALARESTRFDPARPEWLPKTRFLMLMRNARLAALATRFDEDSGTLTVQRDGRIVASGRITEPAGRAVIEQFFASFLEGEIPGVPKLVEAPGHMFSDHRNKVVSLINSASVGDLARVLGKPLDPRRFRGNLYFDGIAKWAELDWPGRQFDLGDARIEITLPIDRCAATNVDPETGARDLNLPRALSDNYGHIFMGVYARIIQGGAIAAGDTLVPA